MRTPNRRRFDAALLAGGSLLAGVAGGAGVVVGDQERVEQLWVRADLAADGSAQVSEVIDYDFGGVAVDKHGIFRVVPDLALSAPITVESDAPSQFTVSPDGDDTKLKIGDPNTRISGRHRYEIAYPLEGMAQGTRVAWNPVGTGWLVPIDQAEIHLFAPYTLDDFSCYVGSQGSTDACDVRVVEPGHLAVEVSGLGDHEGVTLEGTTGGPLPAPPHAISPPTVPDDPSPGLFPPAAAGVAGALAAAGPALWAVRRAGRERVATGGEADAAWATASTVGERRIDQKQLAEMATTEFAPPENLTPAQGGIVLAETVEPEHKVAWLIQEAIDGTFELQEVDGYPGRLIRTANGDDPEPATGDDMSARFVQQAFGGRSEIEFGGYDERFGRAWNALDNGLDTWRVSSGLWDERSDARRFAGLALGIVGTLLGGLIAVAGGAATAKWGVEWAPLAAVGGVLLGIGLAAAIASWELRVRTPAGTAAWLRVESFRRFLAESEAFHAEEAAKRGVLREYTAWAVATGEVDRWSRAVRASSAIPSDAGLSYVYMAPLLLASTSSAATAPSSSGSSGGGFSGSVGGGVGGGGGGSW